MDGRDLISIIVPLYNSGKYVGECIESLISQTYKNIEIILVDDGSTDNAGKICDEYAQKDDRIIVIHKENTGVADSRNRGLDIAKGDFIHFADSDDVMNKRLIEILHDVSVKNDADYVFSDFTKFYENDEVPLKDINEYEIEERDKYYILELYYRQGHDHEINVIPTCKLYRRELFDGIRFPVGRKGEDELTNYKIIYKSHKIIEVKESLYCYRRYPGSLSSDWHTKPRHYMVQAFKEEIEFFENKKDERVIPMIVKRLLDELIHNYKFHLPETDGYANDFKFYYDKYAEHYSLKTKEYDDFYFEINSNSK